MDNISVMKKNFERQRQEKLSSVERERGKRLGMIEQNKRSSFERIDTSVSARIDAMNMQIGELRSALGNPNMGERDKKMVIKRIEMMKMQVEHLKARANTQKREAQFSAEMQKQNVEITHTRTKSNLLTVLAGEAMRINFMERQARQSQRESGKESGKLAG